MSIVLDQVTKRYQAIPVVNDVSLKVEQGEFLVLLGPSGSGKSTLLRAIAGLTEIDHGRVFLHGRDVTHLSAREREVGFVFQHYALFRHMTVGDNIEFALRVRKVKAAERRARRRELLRLVALEGMDDRLPTQLSGGQQQRIAVARALAHRPQVLLMDEPFGALDAKIREELRRTIRQIQRELGMTTILVTHDQEEAFALADRIGVMHQGRLLECGRPDDLYTRPQTRFVSTFLGAANLLLGYRVGGHRAIQLPGRHRRSGAARGRRRAAAGGSRAECRRIEGSLQLRGLRRNRGSALWRRRRTAARADGRRRPGSGRARPSRLAGGRFAARGFADTARAARLPGGDRSPGCRRCAPRARAADSDIELHGRGGDGRRSPGAV